MRSLSDLQQRILKEEYPTMSLESDSDVERYFDLRQNGRQAEALDLYNNRLRRKYPDDAQRALLMRCYRSHDPMFQELLRQNLIILADRIIARTTYVITLLTNEIDSVDMTDAYSVIKLTEGLLSVISPDRYVAIAFTEKYVRYAKRMDFRHEQMERTAELIRLYVTDTIESVQEFKKDREEKRRHHARQQQQKKQVANFDLSKIIFAPADINRILIPNAITRTEDQVIAYCLKYWTLINDPAFEKTVFLYSRKYKTRHSDIFLAVKNGRLHNWKDEEILNAVLANVVTGYYYNITGDLYLQRTWARYKASGQISDPVTVIPAAPALPPKAKKKRILLRSGGKTAKAVTPFKPGKTGGRKTKPALPPAPTFIPNSIADMIKKITRKTYTVYKDLFFKSVRPSIRATLASSAAKKGTIFDGKQNTAEETVYTFLFDHYNDPYQHWKDSPERKQLEETGYYVPDLEPIIAMWVKNNQ